MSKSIKNNLASSPSLQGMGKRSLHRRDYSAVRPPVQLGRQRKSSLEQAVKNAKNTRPITSRKGILFTSVYDLGLQVISKEKLGALCDAIAKRGVSKAVLKRKAERNPFELCMQYLCDDGERKVDPKLQNKWARLLHYAYLHHVKPENLLGFLYQEGPYKSVNARYNKLIAAQSE